MKTSIKPNNIYLGDSRELLPYIDEESIALSVWSPPYFVGKSYEKDLTFQEWQELLKEVISLHYRIVKPGGFVAINISDILTFKDPNMPRLQADLISQKRRADVTKEKILEVLRLHPDWDKYRLAEHFGCSEQTIERRLKGNNVRGGKYATQTKVKLVGGPIERWAEESGFYLYDRRVWVKDPAWANCRWHTSSYRSVDEFEGYIVIGGLMRASRDSFKSILGATRQTLQSMPGFVGSSRVGRMQLDPLAREVRQHLLSGFLQNLGAVERGAESSSLRGTSLQCFVHASGSR